MKIARMAALAAFAAFPLACAAQQGATARALAATCANCHGTDGRSVTKEVKPLAGMAQQDLAAALRAFKAGTRPATVMHQIAKGYNDAQIEALASYFSGVKP